MGGATQDHENNLVAVRPDNEIRKPKKFSQINKF